MNFEELKEVASEILKESPCAEDLRIFADILIKEKQYESQALQNKAQALQLQNKAQALQLEALRQDVYNKLGKT